MISPQAVPVPEWEYYYQGRSGADRPNGLRFIVGARSFWFSYQTLVAFYSPKTGRVVHENVWSRTTGKHLNAIDHGDKASRVDAALFAAKLAEALTD